MVEQIMLDKYSVVYWGWSPSNSLCVDDAGRTLLTQTWSNTETFIVNQVRIRITKWSIKSGEMFQSQMPHCGCAFH